jgi:hypothetical protein
VDGLLAVVKNPRVSAQEGHDLGAGCLIGNLFLWRTLSVMRKRRGGMVYLRS